ncbi:MAG: hypothetical protein GDA44_08440 [Prochloron sp. SP5CPC1]|nr:hypothetical protein [Candidatus Paraprochloron terpiosi SP5CPC1]
MPTNLMGCHQRGSVRILPRLGCFYAEFVYGVEPKPALVDSKQALGIDHGVDTQGNNFIVEVRHLKSLNQWDNKRVATLKENKPQEHGKNNSPTLPNGAIVRCEMQ